MGIYNNTFPGISVSGLITNAESLVVSAGNIANQYGPAIDLFSLSAQSNFSAPAAALFSSELAGPPIAQKRFEVMAGSGFGQTSSAELGRSAFLKIVDFKKLPMWRLEVDDAGVAWSSFFSRDELERLFLASTDAEFVTRLVSCLNVEGEKVFAVKNDGRARWISVVKAIHEIGDFLRDLDVLSGGRISSMPQDSLASFRASLLSVTNRSLAAVIPMMINGPSPKLFADVMKSLTEYKISLNNILPLSREERAHVKRTVNSFLKAHAEADDGLKEKITEMLCSFLTSKEVPHVDVKYLTWLFGTNSQWKYSRLFISERLAWIDKRVAAFNKVRQLYINRFPRISHDTLMHIRLSIYEKATDDWLDSFNKIDTARSDIDNVMEMRLREVGAFDRGLDRGDGDSFVDCLNSACVALGKGKDEEKRIKLLIEKLPYVVVHHLQWMAKKKREAALAFLIQLEDPNSAIPVRFENLGHADPERKRVEISMNGIASDVMSSINVTYGFFLGAKEQKDLWNKLSKLPVDLIKGIVTFSPTALLSFLKELKVVDPLKILAYRRNAPKPTNSGGGGSSGGGINEWQESWGGGWGTAKPPRLDLAEDMAPNVPLYLLPSDGGSAYTAAITGGGNVFFARGATVKNIADDQSEKGTERPSLVHNDNDILQPVPVIQRRKNDDDTDARRAAEKFSEMLAKIVVGQGSQYLMQLNRDFGFRRRGLLQPILDYVTLVTKIRFTVVEDADTGTIIGLECDQQIQIYRNVVGSLIADLLKSFPWAGTEAADLITGDVIAYAMVSSDRRERSVRADSRLAMHTEIIRMIGSAFDMLKVPDKKRPKIAAAVIGKLINVFGLNMIDEATAAGKALLYVALSLDLNALSLSQLVALVATVYEVQAGSNEGLFDIEPLKELSPSDLETFERCMLRSALSSFDTFRNLSAFKDHVITSAKRISSGFALVREVCAMLPGGDKISDDSIMDATLSWLRNNPDTPFRNYRPVEALLPLFSEEVLLRGYSDENVEKIRKIGVARYIHALHSYVSGLPNILMNATLDHVADEIEYRSKCAIHKTWAGRYSEMWAMVVEVATRAKLGPDEENDFYEESARWIAVQKLGTMDVNTGILRDLRIKLYLELRDRIPASKRVYLEWQLVRDVTCDNPAIATLIDRTMSLRYGHLMSADAVSYILNKKDLDQATIRVDAAHRMQMYVATAREILKVLAVFKGLSASDLAAKFIADINSRERAFLGVTVGNIWENAYLAWSANGPMSDEQKRAYLIGLFRMRSKVELDALFENIAPEHREEAFDLAFESFSRNQTKKLFIFLRIIERVAKQFPRQL